MTKGSSLIKWLIFISLICFGKVTNAGLCQVILSEIAGIMKKAEELTSMKSVFFDLTLPINETMLRFPGDPAPLVITERVNFGETLSLRATTIKLFMHVGTHIDSPSHFIVGGKTIDQFPPDLFVGKVFVLDLSKVIGRVITKEILMEQRLPRVERLFIKTANSGHLKNKKFKPDHIYIDKLAAEYLVSNNIKVFGFDYYNIDDSSQSNLDSHLVFAEANTPVIVAVNMSDVAQGEYSMSALPLPYVGCEACQTRVVLWKK